MSIIRADSLKDRAGVGAPNAPNGLNVTGVCTATTFSGSGASLTNLDASDLASGTIPDARFPATLPAINGSNLTNVSAGKVLQIVQQHDTNFARAETNSSSFVATNHQVSITPTAASSKILLHFSGDCNTNGTSNFMHVSIFRSVNGGSFSDIAPYGSSGQVNGFFISNGAGNARLEVPFSIHYLDTPSYSVGNAIVYKLYFRGSGSGSNVEIPCSSNKQPVMCIASEISS